LRHVQRSAGSLGEGSCGNGQCRAKVAVSEVCSSVKNRQLSSRLHRRVRVKRDLIRVDFQEFGAESLAAGKAESH